MSTTERHVVLCCSCVACEICSCGKCCSDFGKREPEESLESVVVTLAARAWRVTRESLVILAKRAWRITRKR